MKRSNTDIAERFNIESKKYKMFWELTNVKDGNYYFENLDYKLNGKL